LKIRHALFTLLAVLAIAFMQPLVFFVGGLTLLLGVGALIFRDLPPADQDAIERRIVGWLRRARFSRTLEIEPPATHRRPLVMAAAESSAQKPERVRRVRARTTATLQSDPVPECTPDPLARDETTLTKDRNYKKNRRRPDGAA